MREKGTDEAEMRYRMLVLDIDGTSTNSQKEVLEETRQAVIRIQEKGVGVILASGRPPQGVYPVAEALEFGRFGGCILAFNGAKGIGYKTRRCLFEKALPAHIPGQLQREARKHGLGMFAYLPDSLAAGTEPDSYMELESRISGLPVEAWPDLSAGLPSVHECVLTGPGEELEILEPTIARRYLHEVQIFHSEPYFLEVTPKNVDKAYGLNHLLRRLNVGWEEVVCCGDSFNDISMLRLAGVGVAMKNGCEELKLVADYVTEQDNNHNGIVEVIRRFFTS